MVMMAHSSNSHCEGHLLLLDWNAEESAITSNNTTLPSFDAVATVDNLTASNTGFIDGDGNFVPRISLDWADGAFSRSL